MELVLLNIFACMQFFRSLAFSAVAEVGVLYGFDGQSNPATSEQIHALWVNPNCDRDSVWDGIRTSIVASTDVNAKEYLRTLDFDTHVNRCMFGMIALLYKATAESLARGDPGLQYLFSLLDSVHGAAHPGLLALSSWNVTDHEINLLREEIIDRSRKLRPGTRTPKIYVYARSDYPEIAQLTQGSSFCSRGQWGTEVHLHDFFWRKRVDDPQEADLFFVPGYAICMFEGGFLSLERIDELYTSLIPKLKYFNAKSGRDHVFTFASGLGLNVFRNWRRFIGSSIILTPETGLFNDVSQQTSPDFVLGKDIALPGHLHRSEIASLISAQSRFPDVTKRPTLAAFFGRIDVQRGSHPATSWMGDDCPRQGILNLANTASSDELTIGQDLTPEEMYLRMARAKFCIIPRGKSAWSLRLYESLWVGCIPVILSDRLIIPFTVGYVPEESFVIRIPMRSANRQELINQLRDIPEIELNRLARNGKNIRCSYSYAHHPGILQETHVELHDSCQGATSAFDHINRDLAQLIHDWRYDQYPSGNIRTIHAEADARKKNIAASFRIHVNTYYGHIPRNSHLPKS